MYATKQAIITQEHAPGTECTIFFIDFRAYGKGFDAYYERAKEQGIRYIRALPSTIKEFPGNEGLCRNAASAWHDTACPGFGG